jgi:hypothetical protein
LRTFWLRRAYILCYCFLSLSQTKSSPLEKRIVNYNDSTIWNWRVPELEPNTIENDKT